MLSREDYLLTFSSTHHALYAEDVLKQAGIVIDVVPIPRTITAECGLAITFSQAVGQLAEKLIISHNIEFKSCYFINAAECLEEKTDFGDDSQ